MDVFIHGRHAGVLTHRSASSDATEFCLAEDYLSDAAGGYVGYGWNGRVSHEYGGVTPGSYGAP